MSEPITASSRLAAARDRLAPVLARVAESALAHERDDTRPREETRSLARAGFGALRVPTELGGGGLSVAEFFEVLVDLGAADSNQPQIWRNHIAFVEDRLAGGTERDRHWLARIAEGAVVGGAWSEVGTASILGDTRIERVDGTLRLNGVKYYSTGSIYADHVGVLALGDDAAPVIALVPADAPGVELVDDWGGFGQRATGSGTTRLRDVPVADDDVLSFEDRFVSQEAVYQLVLLAALAGLARAVRDDAIERVIARTRSYPHALAPSPRDDAQVQQVVGRIAGYAGAAEASVERGARALDGVWDAIEAGGDIQAAARRAAVVVYEAQLTATDAALQASTLVFDALGSSGVQVDAALDRHWRNARTLTSHNPRIYKERVIGAYLLNGTDPLSIYAIEQDDTASAEASESPEASESSEASDRPEASA